jgi:hypothetical protein
MKEVRWYVINYIYEFCISYLCMFQHSVALDGKWSIIDVILAEIIKFLTIFSIYEETVYEQVQKD